MSNVIWHVAAALSGLAIGSLLYHLRLKTSGGSLKERTERIMRDATEEKERILRSAELERKEALVEMEAAFGKEEKRQRGQLMQAEKKLRQRETQLDEKVELLERRDHELVDRERELTRERTKADALVQEAGQKLSQTNAELERIAGMTANDAKEVLVESVKREAMQKAGRHIREIKQNAERDAESEAQRIIAAAVQRLAGGFVAEKTISVVKLESDDLKGRIIGREGRNVRSIEAATGVDIIIDDTPEAVIISSFDPVRRETAKIALEKLVADGRIHPARIEEVVDNAREEMDEVVFQTGEEAIFQSGIRGLPDELVRLVGTLRFRTVNGQNQLDHARETAGLMKTLASELGLEAEIASRAGMLHGIGQAVSHEVPGTAAEVAADHARRYGESTQVVTAIRTYRDHEPANILGVLLQAATKLSSARPGAQREQIEHAIKRLRDLEAICMSFGPVERAYVVQAGTEVRVIVDYGSVTDDEIVVLSDSIAERIENELTYPGEVRVTVLREARATDIAR